MTRFGESEFTSSDGQSLSLPVIASTAIAVSQRAPSLWGGRAHVLAK